MDVNLIKQDSENSLNELRRSVAGVKSAPIFCKAEKAEKCLDLVVSVLETFNQRIYEIERKLHGNKG